MLENLKALREATGLSQRALAEIVGVSQQSINKYENHNIEPDIETLIRIADHFGISVDHLIGRNTEPGTLLQADELLLVKKYRGLSREKQRALLTLLESAESP